MRESFFLMWELALGAMLLCVFPSNLLGKVNDTEMTAQDEYRNELVCFQNEMKRFLSERDYSKALALARKIVKKVEKKCGDSSPDLIAPLIDLGNLYRVAGKQSKAETVMLRSFEISGKTLEWDDPRMLGSLRGLAGVLFDKRKFPDAQPLFLRILAIERKNFGKKSREVQATKEYLGRVFAAQGKLAEAEAVLGKKAFKRLMEEMKQGGDTAKIVIKSKAKWIVGLVIGTIVFILVVMGVSMSRAMRLEVIFFNDVLDVFLSIMPLVVFGSLLLIGLIKQDNEYYTIAWRIVLPVGLCYSVGYNMIAPWFFHRNMVPPSALTLICVGLSRLMITNIFPVGGIIIYVLLSPSRDGDNEVVYEMRKAMMQLKLMLFMVALAEVMRCLINGDAVREMGGKRNSRRVGAETRTREENPGSYRQQEKSRPLNPYDVLGVSANASRDAVVNAYRKLAVKYHPDKVANLGEELRFLANKKMQEINWAYSVILKGNGKCTCP